MASPSRSGRQSTCRAPNDGGGCAPCGRVVAGRNIFGWASNILEGLERLDPRSLPPPPPGKAEGDVEWVIAKKVRKRDDPR